MVKTHTNTLNHTERQPLVVHSYWLAQQPGQPHVGYGLRGQRSAQGLRGLALSGGVLGLFATFGFNLPMALVATGGLLLSPLLARAEGGWYAVDEHGIATAFLGRTPPDYVRGRVGMPAATFLKHARLCPC